MAAYNPDDPTNGYQPVAPPQQASTDWFAANAPPGQATPGGLPGQTGAVTATGQSPAAYAAQFDPSWTPDVPAQGLHQAFSQGLTGQAAVDFANQNYGGGYAYYADKNAYGIPGGNGYISQNGQGQFFYAPGDSGGGSTGSGQANPNANATFSYAPFTGQYTNPAFVPPTGVTEQNDPGITAALAAGSSALQRSAASQGTLLSGQTLAALQQYGQNYITQTAYPQVYNQAAQTYATNSQNAFQQYQQQYQQYLQGFNQAFSTGQFNNAASQQNFANTLNQSAQNFGMNETNFQNQYSLANLGLQSTIAANNAGQNYTNQAGGYLTQAGNAGAAGTVGSANAINYGLGNLANFGTNLALYPPGTQSPSIYGSGYSGNTEGVQY